MSVETWCWALEFDHIQPVEKFVLLMLSDNARLTPVSDLPDIAKTCNLPADKMEAIVEQLMRRGLIRTAPGPAIELCTWVNPDEWNLKTEAVATALAAGKAAKNGR